MRREKKTTKGRLAEEVWRHKSEAHPAHQPLNENVPNCFAKDGDLSVTPSPTEAAKRRALRMWALAWFGVEILPVDDGGMDLGLTVGIYLDGNVEFGVQWSFFRVLFVA